jgi:DNA-binding MarR family transcriptional regulator
VRRALDAEPDRRVPLPSLGENLELVRLLWAIDHGLQKRSKRMASELGVTGPQRLVLRIAGRFPGISAGQLALILHLHPSTLTGVFRRLSQSGLLKRRRDPRDRRRATFELSAAGRRLDVHTAGTIESDLEIVLRTLPPRTIAAARQVLQALAAGLLKKPHAPRSRRRHDR